MDAIYANSEEKFLKKVKLYPDEDSVLCLDEDATEKISMAGLINLFEKGEILVVTDDGEFVPVSMEIDGEQTAAVVVITVTESQGAFTAVPQYFYSDTVS